MNREDHRWSLSINDKTKREKKEQGRERKWEQRACEDVRREFGSVAGVGYIC